MMDTHGCAALKLFVVGILVNVWMMKGLSATDSFSTEPTPPRPSNACNESRLQLEVEVCGEDFKRDMAHIDPQNWCNLTHFISTSAKDFENSGDSLTSEPNLCVLYRGEYHVFTLCTETKSQIVHCYWPNPLVESYIIRIHKHFFSNCTMEQVVWVDPPDDTLTILILIPVFLTMAMIALVVWCSKRSDILA
ncbi:receptor activity-modifying protein 3-like isoform X2 [Xiphias gladius]|uniref:receptor activity-modifying protein 3-like isoform X2 n=1 Tax=Xiphias gladius TaxID=8245 RepID=UPI001A98B029|nr:receptor activity-modifying protein 3-like isoform X2 [Xiphias gladius]